MQRTLAALALLAASAHAGGTLKLTWQDCGDGSYHGKVGGLTPDTITLGQKTTLTGTGSVSEAVSAGTFAIDMKAGIMKQHFTGNICEAKTFKLPLGVGTVTWDGIKCPIAVGATSVATDITLSSSMPKFAQKATISIAATATNNDKLLCMKITTAPSEGTVVVTSSQGLLKDDNLLQMFEQFKKRFHKTYPADEEEKRFTEFKKNIGRADELNNRIGTNCAWSKKGDNCPYGVTEFSDLHKDEFKARLLGLKPNGNKTGVRVMPPPDYAHALDVSKKDWRDVDGVVTPMKNQNPCGVCWAFSAASTMESAYAIKYQTSAPILSPEELVECDGHHGCSDGTSGGRFDQAWDYVKGKGGLATVEDYPITCCGEDHLNNPDIEQCRSAPPKVTTTGYQSGPDNEDELAAAVAAKGPFSIAVAAESWQHWTGGSSVMTACDGNLDHAVSVVGFDKSANPPYWIVRNQWGTGWGDNGYIKLQFGQNTCQMTTLTQIVQVEDVAKSKTVVV